MPLSIYRAAVRRGFRCGPLTARSNSRRPTMRFMIMHKMTEAMERGEQPDPAVFAGIEQLIQEGQKSNVFISGEGLKPSSERVHVRYRAGKRTVTEGPFTDPKELVGGFGLFQVNSREEALSWCDR